MSKSNVQMQSIGCHKSSLRHLGALCVTLCFVFLLPLFAKAQSLPPGTIKSQVVKSESGSFMVVKLTGSIAYPIARELDDIVKNMDPSIKRLVLHLDSGGGSIQEGLLIISTLRKLKQRGLEVDSTVHNGEICGSMCVPLFLQGTKRYAGEVSSFMFHGAVLHGFTNVPDEVKTREYLNIFIDAGVSTEWLDLMWERKVFSTPGSYWMSAKELVVEKAGIVTDLQSRHDIQKPWETPFDPNIRRR